MFSLKFQLWNPLLNRYHFALNLACCDAWRVNVKKWLTIIWILVATDTDTKQTLDTPTNSGELIQTLVLITMVASEN